MKGARKKSGYVVAWVRSREKEWHLRFCNVTSLGESRLLCVTIQPWESFQLLMIAKKLITFSTATPYDINHFLLGLWNNGDALIRE